MASVPISTVKPNHGQRSRGTVSLCGPPRRAETSVPTSADLYSLLVQPLYITKAADKVHRAWVLTQEALALVLPPTSCSSTHSRQPLFLEQFLAGLLVTFCRKIQAMFSFCSSTYSGFFHFFQTRSLHVSAPKGETKNSQEPVVLGGGGHGYCSS